MAGIESQLAALTAMSSARLRAEWSRVTGGPVPRVSPAMLRLALAWEIQAKAHSGLSRATQQKLDQIGRAKTQTSAAQPGMRLVREWNGRTHVVLVGDDKVIRWNEREWASLSEVARAITGTSWSGLAFFGLARMLAA